MTDQSPPEQQDEELTAYQQRCLAWFESQHKAYAQLTDTERADLANWDRYMVTGEGISTADWPGWARYIGLPPWETEEPPTALDSAE